MSALWASFRGVLGMADKRRLNLSFSMASTRQRAVWKILSATPPGRRTDTVCRIVQEHAARQELLEAVRTVVREELERFQPQTTIVKEHPAGAVDDNVLGFLLSLQQEEGDNP